MPHKILGRLSISGGKFSSKGLKVAEDVSALISSSPYLSLKEKKRQIRKAYNNARVS